MQDFNISKLNLTWSVTKYYKDYMVISLKFYHPEEISPLSDLDELVFHIIDPGNFFISATEIQILHSDYRTLKHTVRK